jgi:hypothetical protein
MHNVIGKEYEENERKALWNSMLNYKGSYELFSKKDTEWEKSIAKRDKKRYDTFLSHYVKRRFH